MGRRHQAIEELRQGTDPCLCVSLRKAARAATHIYDRCLKSSGLSTAQYSLLMTLYFAGAAMPVSALAARLDLDRTTLTRNLAVLERRGLVEVETPENDRRTRAAVLTAAGTEALAAALPLWREAQAR